MNTVVLSGRLGKEPELKQAQSGKLYATYSLAVDGQKSGDKKETYWFNCVCFDKTAEFASTYLHKGDKVAVLGEIQISEYLNNEGKNMKDTKIVVKQHEFLNVKEKAEPATSEKPAAGYDLIESDKDLPF